MNILPFGNTCKGIFIYLVLNGRGPITDINNNNIEY